MLRKPKPLSPGDTVAVVAPAGAYEPERLEQGCRIVEGWGLKVRRPQSGPPERYLAGSDERRAAELNAAFSDPTVQGVIAARGGFGSARLGAGISFAPAPGSPKPFVGFSDNTVLLTRLMQEARWIAFHGPMIAADLPELSTDARERFRRFLFDEDDWWIGAARETYRSGRATGRLTGGCLSVLCTTLGTAYEIETDDRVLFLEDVNEAPYRVERMLVQLRDAGKFARTSGLVIGAMQGCGEPGDEALIRDIVLDVLGACRFPIIAGLSAGHGTDNGVLPLGCRVTVDGAAKRLTLDESPFAQRA